VVITCSQSIACNVAGVTTASIHVGSAVVGARIARTISVEAKRDFIALTPFEGIHVQVFQRVSRGVKKVVELRLGSKLTHRLGYEGAKLSGEAIDRAFRRPRWVVLVSGFRLRPGPAGAIDDASGSRLGQRDHLFLLCRR
jgi:hypothetical protein